MNTSLHSITNPNHTQHLMISPARYSVLTSFTDIFRRKIAIFLFCLLPALATAAPLDVYVWTLSANHELATMTPGTLSSSGAFTPSPFGGISIGGIPGVDVTTQIPGGQYLTTINGKTVYPGGYTEWLNFLAIQESWGDYSYRQNYSTETTEYAINGDKYSVVTVNVLPSFTTQPVSQTIIAGANVTFSAVATGTPTPTHQWKFNGTAISGATGTSYTISNTTTANAGTYTVTATNARGSVTSSAATLTVQPPAPAITVPTLTSATVSEPFIFLIAATNNPTSYNAIGLPAGLSINTSTGLISGTPTTTGGFSVSLTATNSTAVTTASLNLVVAPSVAVTTLAGTLGVSGSLNGTGTSASFNNPAAIVSDSTDSLYVADKLNHVIRKISPLGVVSTLAGLAGSTGSTDGTGTSARFNRPTGIAIDSTSNLFVTDQVNNTIRKITPAGVVSIFAGAAGISGSVDNTGTQARFNGPAGITIDASGNLYVAESSGHTIRKITAAGAVTTIAGAAGVTGLVNSTGTAARFNMPLSIAIDSANNLYIGDTGNYVIRKINLATGNVSTFAGEGTANGTPSSGDNIRFLTNGVYKYGAFFSQVTGLAVDQAGCLYASDASNDTVRRIDLATGSVSTIAGFAQTTGSVNGIGSTARFTYPNGLAIDPSGLLFVADMGNHAIRVLSFGPSIVTQPQSQTVTTGTNVTLSVVASGSPSPACQWYKDNIIIAGATTSTLTLSNAQSVNAGTYKVTLTNASGTVTSSNATLTINAAPSSSSGSSNSSGAGNSGGGGGGAPSDWFFAALTGTGLLRTLLSGRKH